MVFAFLLFVAVKASHFGDMVQKLASNGKHANARQKKQFDNVSDSVNKAINSVFGTSSPISNRLHRLVNDLDETYQSGTASPDLQFFESLIYEINNKTTYWTAGKNHFTKMSKTELENFAKTKTPETKALTRRKLLQTSTSVTLPQDFDPRGHHCISPITDQGQCGSCWAFSGK